MSEVIHYVNKETGRIVNDPATILEPEKLSDYTEMNEAEYHEYCIEQRRKLDASKEEHRKAEEAFEAKETKRINKLAKTISDNLGISLKDAKTMVPRQQYDNRPDFSVSEKVFGDIVLPEEEGDNGTS